MDSIELYDLMITVTIMNESASGAASQECS